jgi:hypothetical protein
MRQSDSGQGYAKAVFAFAVLFALIFVGIKAVPVYVNNYQLTDWLRDRVVRASVERTPVEVVQQEVVAYANSLRLPVEPRNVKVAFSGNVFRIDCDYTVPVDLAVYTWVLHFTPSAENTGM